MLSGQPTASGGVQTALVIDTSGLSGTTQLQLQNVDFAAIIGAAHVTGGDGSQKVWGDSASQYIVLGADDDTLHGGDGDDTVGSEGGNDHIYGDGGNDVVFGGIGNDYIDGGTGTDTVLLTGASRADYSLRIKDGMIVSTALTGTDGIDTIANVEILQFAGPDTTAAGSIGRLYEAMLGRPADTAGREYWVGQHAAGVSMETIAAAIVGSNEALGQQLGDAAYVEQMYQSLLHRTGDTAGMAFWSQQLANGTVTRAGLALQFADSAEKLAMPSSSQLDFNHSDVATLVRMYEALFDRAPDETGLNFWIGAHEGGMAMRTLAQGFLASSESAAHYASLDDAHFVAELYQTALGHGPRTAEANEWAVKLAAGQVTRADVLLGIADSDEMVQLVGAVSTSIATV